MGPSTTHPLGLLLAAVSVLVACGGRPTEAPVQEPSHTRDVLDRGTLVFLCFPVQQSSFVAPNLDVLRERGIPLSELRDPDGYGGSEVDLIRGFAEWLGVSLEIHPITTTYGDLIQAVVEGTGDLAASSLTVSEERDKIVDFSDPTESVWAVIGGRLDSPLITLDDLSGTRVRGMEGASQVDLFETIRPPDVELTLGDYSLDNYLAVIEGEADYMLMDSSAEIGEPASEDYHEVKVVLRLEDTNYGIAFPEGSDLRDRFNEYFAELSAGDR